MIDQESAKFGENTRNAYDTSYKRTHAHIHICRIENAGNARRNSRDRGRRCGRETRVAIERVRPGREEDRDVRVFIGNWRCLRELTGAGLRETVGNPIKTNGLRKYFVSLPLSPSLSLTSPFFLSLSLFLTRSLRTIFSLPNFLIFTHAQYSPGGGCKRLKPPIRRFSCIYTEYETFLLAVGKRNLNTDKTDRPLIAK